MLSLDELCKLVHSGIQEAINNEKMVQARVNAKRHNRYTKHAPNGWPSLINTEDTA